MYGRKVLSTGAFFIIGTMLILGLIAGSTALAATGDDTPESSNLIINCSFGEEGKKQCGFEHLFQLANNIMKLLLWLAITGAGILIFYRGAILAINVFVKGGDQDARKKAQDALKAVLFGLIFILSAYLIVKAGFNIIGYNLGNPFQWNEADLPPVGGDGSSADEEVDEQGAGQSDNTKPPASTALSTDEGAPTDTCSGCQVDTASLSSVNFKQVGQLCTSNQNRAGNAWNNTRKCWVSTEVRDRLNTLADKSDANWRVTEACPPTAKVVRGALESVHSNSCHSKENCTCVDANFDGTSPTPENIVAFIVAAENSRFKAVYEVKEGGTDYDNLKSSVVDKLKEEGFSEVEAKKRICNYSSITKDHFSLYSQHNPNPCL